MNNNPPIRIAAAIITDGSGRCLLVRKHGTTHFIQPGGKMEPDELPVAALSRELREELHLELEEKDFSYVGRFADNAINEPGKTVVAEIYHSVSDVTEFLPAAEIAEVVWYSPEEQPALLLAPLTENHLIPLVIPLCQKASSLGK